MIENIKILKNEVLADNWYVLRKVTFQYLKKDGSVLTQSREAYDRGNGAVILLYDQNRRTIILTSQFRLPTYINGNPSGMMIEACAGLLDDEHPDVAIKRETEEETGYQITEVEKIYEAYMSPGSVTEILHFFIAKYTHEMKVNDGGGVDHEEENIEVLEMDYDQALTMIESGEIKDAKTIMLIHYLRVKEIL